MIVNQVGLGFRKIVGVKWSTHCVISLAWNDLYFEFICLKQSKWNVFRLMKNMKLILVIDEEHETHFSDAKFRITEVAFVLFDIEGKTSS